MAGQAGNGRGGDLVAFLRDAVCSDGMSDTKHPVIARVSLADGRFLAGCCRIVPATTAAPVAATSIEGPTWRLTALRGLDPRVLRDADATGDGGLQGGSHQRFLRVQPVFRAVHAGSRPLGDRAVGRIADGVRGTSDEDRERRACRAGRNVSLRPGRPPPDAALRHRADPDISGGTCPHARGGDLEDHRLQQWPAGRRQSVVGHHAFR